MKQGDRMTNHKASWKLYSSRRKITLESLVQQGKVTDYATYSDYCVKMHVEPISESEFGRQAAGLLRVKTTAAPAAAPTPQAPHPEEVGVEATVWLAGVQQESESPVPADDRRTSKKKKSADSQQGES
jgi:hypothetical protein